MNILEHRKCYASDSPFKDWRGVGGEAIINARVCMFLSLGLEMGAGEKSWGRWCREENMLTTPLVQGGSLLSWKLILFLLL